MAKNIDNANNFTMALLRAAGIPGVEDAVAVTYHYEIGTSPTFEVSYVKWDADANDLQYESIRFVPGTEST
jgi:hypothetical protein